MNQKITPLSTLTDADNMELQVCSGNWYRVCLVQNKQERLEGQNQSGSFQQLASSILIMKEHMEKIQSRAADILSNKMKKNDFH